MAASSLSGSMASTQLPTDESSLRMTGISSTSSLFGGITQNREGSLASGSGDLSSGTGTPLAAGGGLRFHSSTATLEQLGSAIDLSFLRGRGGANAQVIEEEGPCSSEGLSSARHSREGSSFSGPAQEQFERQRTPTPVSHAVGGQHIYDPQSIAEAMEEERRRAHIFALDELATLSDSGGVALDASRGYLEASQDSSLQQPGHLGSDDEEDAHGAGCYYMPPGAAGGSGTRGRAAQQAGSSSFYRHPFFGSSGSFLSGGTGPLYSGPLLGGNVLAERSESRSTTRSAGAPPARGPTRFAGGRGEEHDSAAGLGFSTSGGLATGEREFDDGGSQHLGGGFSRESTVDASQTFGASTSSSSDALCLPGIDRLSSGPLSSRPTLGCPPSRGFLGMGVVAALSAGAVLCQTPFARTALANVAALGQGGFGSSSSPASRQFPSSDGGWRWRTRLEHRTQYPRNPNPWRTTVPTTSGTMGGGGGRWEGSLAPPGEGAEAGIHVDDAQMSELQDLYSQLSEFAEVFGQNGLRTLYKSACSSWTYQAVVVPAGAPAGSGDNDNRSAAEQYYFAADGPGGTGGTSRPSSTAASRSSAPASTARRLQERIEKAARESEKVELLGLGRRASDNVRPAVDAEWRSHLLRLRGIPLLREACPGISRDRTGRYLHLGRGDALPALTESFLDLRFVPSFDDGNGQNVDHLDHNFSASTSSKQLAANELAERKTHFVVTDLIFAAEFVRGSLQAVFELFHTEHREHKGPAVLRNVLFRRVGDEAAGEGADALAKYFGIANEDDERFVAGVLLEDVLEREVLWLHDDPRAGRRVEPGRGSGIQLEDPDESDTTNKPLFPTADHINFYAPPPSPGEDPLLHHQHPPTSSHHDEEDLPGRRVDVSREACLPGAKLIRDIVLHNIAEILKKSDTSMYDADPRAQSYLAGFAASRKFAELRERFLRELALIGRDVKALSASDAQLEASAGEQLSPVAKLQLNGWLDTNLGTAEADKIRELLILDGVHLLGLLRFLTWEFALREIRVSGRLPNLSDGEIRGLSVAEVYNYVVLRFFSVGGFRQLLTKEFFAELGQRRTPEPPVPDMMKETGEQETPYETGREIGPSRNNPMQGGMRLVQYLQKYIYARAVAMSGCLCGQAVVSGLRWALLGGGGFWGGGEGGGGEENRAEPGTQTSSAGAGAAESGESQASVAPVQRLVMG
eukprot:g6731.t1